MRIQRIYGLFLRAENDIFGEQENYLEGYSNETGENP